MGSVWRRLCADFRRRWGPLGGLAMFLGWIGGGGPARPPGGASMPSPPLPQVALPVRRGLPDAEVEPFASPDRAAGVSADRVKILEGRLFPPGAAGQAVIDPQLAAREHLRPGGTLHLLGIPNNPRTGAPEPWLAARWPSGCRRSLSSTLKSCPRPR